MRQTLKQRLAGAFDLPMEVLLDLSRIVLIGNTQAFIENHRGIMEYSPDKIVIACSKGQVAIFGENLLVKCILPEEIELAGRITSVVFEE